MTDRMTTVTVTWHPITTMPTERRVIVCDTRHPEFSCEMAIAERSTDGEMIVNVLGFPTHTAAWWMHWCEMPSLPGGDDAC